MAKKKESKKYACHCNQCGYDWSSKKKHPLHCASCISDKWDKELVGKKLRKAVPSRVRLQKKIKRAAAKEVARKITEKKAEKPAPVEASDASK